MIEEPRMPNYGAATGGGAITGADAMNALFDRLKTAEHKLAEIRDTCKLDGYEVSNEFGTYDVVAVENIIDILDGK